MIATEHDYDHDLAADLALAEAATPAPWKYAGCPDHIGIDGLSCWGLRAADGSRIEQPQDQRLLAAARTAMPIAIRRAQVAEAAILDLDRAWSADAHEPGLIDRLEVARSDVKRIAARIREGRGKGAGA
jgi:hypothetical protein